MMRTIALLGFLVLLFLTLACRSTVNTESFRLHENLSLPGDYQEMNRIANAFDGWHISLSLWSMRQHYRGQGVGKNQYRAEIWVENTRDSSFPGYYVGAAEMDTLPDAWIEVDSILITSTPRDLRTVVFVDTTVLEKYPGSYKLGSHFPFTSVHIPPEINEIQVSFEARLRSKKAGIVEKKPLAFHLFRFSEKRPGPYFWNRCN